MVEKSASLAPTVQKLKGKIRFQRKYQQALWFHSHEDSRISRHHPQNCLELKKLLNWAALRSPAKSLMFSRLKGNPHHQTLKTYRHVF